MMIWMLLIGTLMMDRGAARSKADPLVEARKTRPDSSPVSYIVGGKEATPHDWPWVVSLQYENQHLCGGSLISDRWVLTAAHCKIEELMQVMVGMHSKTHWAENQEMFKVKRSIPHPNYDTVTFNNDIMLLLLDGNVTFGDTVQPVSLPTNWRATYKKKSATSWAGEQRQGGSQSDWLLETRVKIYPHKQCAAAYGDSYTDNMMCAGFDGSDTCQGDSGGPLVYQEYGKWVQLGITSYGYGCATIGYPGVYTKVSNYLNWIRKYVK